jgi:hypothetical protein
MFRLVGKDSEVEIRLKDYIYSEASEVLKVGDDVLFASVHQVKKGS